MIQAGSKMNRAERRRQDREQAKRGKQLGQPPKVMPDQQQGVSIDVVDDGVIVSIHSVNTVFSVKWTPHDCGRIAEMLLDASRQTKAVVERESGLVIAHELP